MKLHPSYRKTETSCQGILDRLISKKVKLEEVEGFSIEQTLRERVR